MKLWRDVIASLLDSPFYLGLSNIERLVLVCQNYSYLRRAF